MNRKVGLITFVVFLLFVAAGVAAVFALGTSTGVVVGGSASTTAVGSVDAPYKVQAGWIRNNSPWPVTIESIDLNETGAASDPVLYLSDARPDDTPLADGEVPAWTTTPAEFPFTMAGGSLQFIGYSIVPATGTIATFDTITVNFKGPLPFDFDTSYQNVAIGVAAADFPADLVAADPGEDPTSLDGFVALLRSAITSGDIGQIQRLMADNTSVEAATALRDSQAGFTAEMPVVSDVLTEDSRSWTIRFYATDVAVDGLPSLAVKWDDFRWRVSLAG